MRLNNIDSPSFLNGDPTMRASERYHGKTRDRLMSITDGGGESGGNGKNISKGDIFETNTHIWYSNGLDLENFATFEDFVSGDERIIHYLDSGKIHHLPEGLSVTQKP